MVQKIYTMFFSFLENIFKIKGGMQSLLTHGLKRSRLGDCFLHVCFCYMIHGDPTY
jgi:hypothetical protein